MKRDRCANCDEELTDIEQNAKENDKAEEWWCYECFGDGSMCLSEHGKYIKLLTFVKKVSNNFCFNQTDDEGLESLVNFEKEADELLKKIGESDD